MDNLFSTHPATENRIAALLAMAGQRRGGSVAVPRVGRTGPAGPSAACAARGPWG